MTTHDLAKHLVDEFSPGFGPREAASMARLVLEDLFNARPGARPRQLSQDEQILAWTATNRIKGGEPVQYVTGVADFYGLRLRVTPAVLIPRPETEELVEWVLEDHGVDTARRLLDVGTGSGCIALAATAQRPSWNCTGIDVSDEALGVASANAERLNLRTRFSQKNILREAPEDRYHIMVSNPPYIPPSERDRVGADTLAHEPELALFVAEEDPLIFYRRLAEIAPASLQAGGYLYCETNEFNHDEVVGVLRAGPFAAVGSRTDLQGKKRMVRAVLPR